MIMRTKLFTVTGLLFLILGVIIGWYLKNHASSYSDELEAAFRAFFWFGNSLSFFIIAVVSRKTLKPKLFYTLAFLVIIFIFLMSFPFLIMPGIPPIRYAYESSDRKFAMHEHVGGKISDDKTVNFNDVKREFEEYRHKHKASDVYLCRTFLKNKKIKWYHLYIWLEYEFGSRWQLPYCEPVGYKNSVNEKTGD